MAATVYAVCNQKGGCAKTVTSVNFGIGLARMGRKVLLIDMDAQGSMTASLGYQQPDRLEITLATILSFIINDIPLPEGFGILHHEEGVDLLPAVYAQLSPRRSLAQDGIELMGGLTIDPGYEGYLVFGLRNVAGTPYPLSPGTKIVAANFFELNKEEMLSEYKKPASIESFPEKLLTLIEKYKPVNPQNLEMELKELQKAFRESQGQLGEDVRGLKEKVGQIANDLLKESTKREQENKSLSDRFSSVEVQLRELDSKTVKTDLKLDRVQEDIQKIGNSIDEIKDNIIKKMLKRE